MASILLYIAVASFSAVSMHICQKAYVKNCKVYKDNRKLHHKYKWTRVSAYPVKMFLLFIIAMLPIIIMYGFRYGIGEDYYSYETMYEALNGATFSEYWHNHSIGYGDYYVEAGYFLLNKFSISFTQVKLTIIVIMCCILFVILSKYENKVSKGMVVFVYLTTQFFYAMNGVRFSIAAMFLLWAYTKIEEGKKLTFLVLLVCASLFHKSALFCIAFYFLKEFSGTIWNKLRNFITIAAIFLLPIVFTYVVEIIAKISILSRYIETSSYAPSSMISSIGFKWLMHIVPVLLPIVLLSFRKKIMIDSSFKMYLRICCMEIPLRMLAVYNPLYTRLARYAQIAQCILVPFFLGSIKSRKIKKIISFYYIVWYIFYLVYYLIIIDQSHSIPYNTIFKY